MTETTASKIHMPHAKFLAQSPHAGTQTSQNIEMIVVSPIGNVPMKSDCTECVIMGMKVSGYNVYRKMERINPSMNRKTLKTKMITDIHHSQ